MITTVTLASKCWGEGGGGGEGGDLESPENSCVLVAVRLASSRLVAD